MSELKSKIEAVLFLTGRAVTLKEISDILNAPEEEIELSMLELITDYASREGALEIDDENGYIIQVKDDFSDIADKLCPADISNAALKTLAVIALKGPIRQSELKEVRGSNTYEHIKELVEKGFVSRKKDKNGKSFNVKTTEKFKEYFKLKGNAQKLAQADMKRLTEILELNK